MGMSCVEAPSGPYHLIAQAYPPCPILFKTILESWCTLNCSGKWDTQLDDGVKPLLTLVFDHVDDLMLFMMSREYTHMGSPTPSSSELA